MNNDNILDTFVVDTSITKIELVANEPFFIKEIGLDKHHNNTRKLQDSKVYEISYTYDESKLKNENYWHRWA